VRRVAGRLVAGRGDDVGHDRETVVDVVGDVGPQFVDLALGRGVVGHLDGVVRAGVDAVVHDGGDLADVVGAAGVGAQLRGQRGLAGRGDPGRQRDPGGGRAAPVAGLLDLVVDLEDLLGLGVDAFGAQSRELAAAAGDL